LIYLVCDGVLQHPIVQTATRVLFALYAIIVLSGVGVVLVRDPVIETPRRPDARAAFDEAAPGITDYAHWKRGAVVRASSYHTLREHHPLFLIDGVADNADPLRKWVSRPDDQDPWIEVEFAAPIDVFGVVVAHAGVVESPNLSVKRYQIVCLRGDEEVARQAAFVQVAEWERHDTVCADTDTVRLEIQAGEGRAQKEARIYEIEVYGEPADD
jgi:hypothetical protein